MKKALGVIVIVAALAIAPAAALAHTRPNIVLILTDDLGFGDVGFTCDVRTNALAKPRTPCLDRLAREGVVLTAHYAAAPVCAPSRASLLTGQVQGRCSLRDNCFDRAFTETNTLASVLHNAGYTTWAVGKWGVAGGGESGECVSSHPLDRGFDYFYGFLDHMAGHTYYHYEGHIRNAFMGITENRTNATDSAKGIYSTDLFVAKAKQLVSRHAGRATTRLRQSIRFTSQGGHIPPRASSGRLSRSRSRHATRGSTPPTAISRKTPPGTRLQSPASTMRSRTSWASLGASGSTTTR